MRKMDSGRSGLGCLCSLKMKAPSKTADPAMTADRARVPPTDLRDANEGVDQEEHATGHGRGAECIKVGERCSSSLFGHDPEGGNQENGAERKVDEEHPSPAKLLSQNSSEENSHS